MSEKQIQPLPWRAEQDGAGLWRVMDAQEVMVLRNVTKDEAAFIVGACNQPPSPDGAITRLRALIEQWKRRAYAHGEDGDRARQREVTTCMDELEALLASCARQHQPLTVAHRAHCPWHDTEFIELRPGEFCCAICMQEKRTIEPACSRSTETQTPPEVERRLRAYLWLSHGHQGQYGDDGEMQCSMCARFGAWDYRREPLEKLLDVIQAVSLDAILSVAKPIEIPIPPDQTGAPE